MPRKLILGLALLLALCVLARLVVGLESPADLAGPGWATSFAGQGPTASPAPLSVTARVQALYQGDPTIGWDSRQQYDLWWPSACSPAALTMVLRAWNTPVQIGEVLDKLIAHQAITPQQGLLHVEALVAVAGDFGFQGKMFWRLTLQQMAQLTGQGVPVLVDLVDAKRQTAYPGFSVGHWLVVVGISTTQIAVRDSSGYHIRSFSLSTFGILFTGIAVVIWKGAAISLP